MQAQMEREWDEAHAEAMMALMEKGLTEAEAEAELEARND